MKARGSVYRGPGGIGVRKGSNLWVPDCEQGSLSVSRVPDRTGGGEEAKRPCLLGSRFNCGHWNVLEFRYKCGQEPCLLGSRSNEEPEALSESWRLGRPVSRVD